LNNYLSVATVCNILNGIGVWAIQELRIVGFIPMNGEASLHETGLPEKISLRNPS